MGCAATKAPDVAGSAKPEQQQEEATSANPKAESPKKEKKKHEHEPEGEKQSAGAAEPGTESLRKERHKKNPSPNPIVELLNTNPEKLDLSRAELTEKGLNGWMKYLGAPPRELFATLSITELNLCDNELQSIVGVENLVNLTTLNISENLLVSLPGAIGKLIKLEEFVGYKNKLTALPDSFTDLISLIECNFYNNKLQELPWNINKLENLESLNFANNPLIALPKFEGLSKLKSIKCHMCNIEKIDGSWETLEALTELMFNSNKITDIPTLPPNVEQLDFVRCKLEVIAPERFANCIGIQEFKANANCLSVFPVGVLVASLENLGISDNPGVKTIPPEIGNCSAVCTLVLNGTGISTLPIELLKLSSITRFNVQKCPIDHSDPTTKQVLEQLQVQCSAKDEKGKAIGYYKV